MSKANQNFVQADEAVSPVIGVILMVAITVVLAAVVFVLVSNLSKTSDKGEDSSATVSSPQAGRIYITLVRQGQNGPYTTGTTNPESVISVDNQACTLGEATTNEGVLGATGSTANEWEAGETIIIGALATAADCGDDTSLVAGSTHFVTVVVHGTLILDNVKVVIQ